MKASFLRTVISLIFSMAPLKIINDSYKHLKQTKTPFLKIKERKKKTGVSHYMYLKIQIICKQYTTKNSYISSSGLWLWWFFCNLIWNKADSFDTIIDNLVRRQAKAKKTAILVYVGEVQSNFLACTGNGKEKGKGREGKLKRRLKSICWKDTHILVYVHGR